MKRQHHLINRQAAPWLFKGTGLRNGATFGNYGIEIDEPNTVSPDDTDVLAEIPHEFGNSAADRWFTECPGDRCRGQRPRGRW